MTWTIEYDGFMAELIKAAPVLLMAAFIFFPYPLYAYVLLPWSLSLGEPGCYLIFIAWWSIIVGSAVAAAIVGYIRESL